ncbi:conserved hypothetical protein [Thiomonas sp. X19]|uniref:uroporphyrinogen-III C-methyltransferase n=1 Tax=Thiomonas sp. X19 TaxID=1050370 RepID=UPI000B67856B|nr:uroporphyrinogen-III C-methyltransferase [Thiomonas sp. X19]SCC94574.1 conserved hypothetical protein [Thiomonas sp. X19]
MSEPIPPQAAGVAAPSEPMGSNAGEPATLAGTPPPEAPIAPSLPPAGWPGQPPAAAHGLRLVWLAIVALLLLVAVVAWWLDGRLYATQAEIARRLQNTDTTSIEARTIAKQSAEASRELMARVAVLESREQDLAAQRQALQQLYQDFAKSRDDAFLGQTAELIALAQQQAELTGSLSPLVSTLESSVARLKRANNPRAALVLRAVQQDLSRLKSSVAPDIPAAAQRLDALAALVDQLQPLSSAAPLEGTASEEASTNAGRSAQGPGWAPWLGRWAHVAWEQVRQLVSITKVDRPNALLMAPTQTDYLRENLKLQVLNARLDLLSRNASGYKADMRRIEQALRASFNERQPRTQTAMALARQAGQIDLAAQPATNLQSLAVLATLGLGSN